MAEPMMFDTISLAELASLGLVTEVDCPPSLVLVVDDDPVLADTRAAVLRGWGFLAMTAYDGESALEIARLVKPELLVGNVSMARSNGIDLAIAIRQFAPDCQVILIVDASAGLSTASEQLGLERQFKLLLKPIDPVKLQSHLFEMDFKVELAARSGGSLSRTFSSATAI